MSKGQRIPMILCVLLVLFVLRVIGQLVVLIFEPAWLPPMKDWYSGLLPYPLLLPSQIAIIVLMIVMIRQVSRPNAPQRRLAIGIWVFAAIYAGVMLVRLIILRTSHPELLWYEGGAIPVMFHWVLATFLVLYGRRRGAGGKLKIEN